MKSLESINVYKEADLIVQINGFCGRKKKDKCKGCYVKSFGKKVLNVERYLSVINTLQRGDLIVLRGGEPTLAKDWFEKFVFPALILGLIIIIETNGYFIDRSDYDEIMKKLCHKNIFIRISFDNRHLFGLNERSIQLEFYKMASFAEKALKRGINFAFYSLGMNNKKILEFIKGTTLEPFGEYFYSLLYYKDISTVKLHREYLRADGKIFNYIKTD